MGKIDKEKLLREIHCKGTGNFNGSGCCNGCNNYNDDHNTTGECLNSIIKNFPEDPEIDFDALYKEYLGSVQFGSIPTAWQFRDFLKAKHLTAPKPVEIPVKKTWSLKKHVEEIFHDFGNTPYPLTLDPPENLKKYYNLHEEPDYSKIPKGSIVEIEFVSGNENNCGYVNGITNKSISIGFHMLYNSGNSTTINFDQIESIVILKLAKENV